jgi:hypothetical protein
MRPAGQPIRKDDAMAKKYDPAMLEALSPEWERQQRLIDESAVQVYAEVFPWFRAEHYGAWNASNNTYVVDAQAQHATMTKAGEEWHALTGLCRLNECNGKGWTQAMVASGARSDTYLLICASVLLGPPAFYQ